MTVMSKNGLLFQKKRFWGLFHLTKYFKKKIDNLLIHFPRFVVC